MATKLPPPKRVKLSGPTVDAPVPVVPKAPTVVVQFRSIEGQSMGPAVALPADTGREGLEGVVNSLKGGEAVPYSFTLLLPSPISPEESIKIPLPSSLQSDILNPSPAVLALLKEQGLSQSVEWSSEDVFTILCEPQAIYKVRPVGRCGATLTGHDSPILCSQISPDGKWAVTGSGDSHARIWDLETELPHHTLKGHRGWVLCTAFSPLSNIVATASHDGSVRLWDVKTGKPIGGAMDGHKKWVMDLAWEPLHSWGKGGARIASAGKDGTVRVWNVGTRRVEFVLGGHTACVHVVRWGGEGLIYTGSADRSVRIWDGKDGKLVRVLNDHAHWVTTMALSTDHVLRAGPYDQTGKPPKDEEDAKKKALEFYRAHTALKPELLITGSDDHTLYLWPSQNSSPSPKKPISRLTGHQKPISHVSFSPDARYIASAGLEGSVKIWDGSAGKFVGGLRGHVASVYRIAWSRDSRMVISASKDSTLKIWDLKTYKIKVDLPGHTDEVYCVDWVADKVISGGRDKTVKIWKH